MTNKKKRLPPEQMNALLGVIIAIPVTWALFHYVLDPFLNALYHHPYSIWWKIGAGIIISGGIYGILTKSRAYENMAYGKK